MVGVQNFWLVPAHVGNVMSQFFGLGQRRTGRVAAFSQKAFNRHRIVFEQLGRKPAAMFLCHASGKQAGFHLGDVGFNFFAIGAMTLFREGGRFVLRQRDGRLDQFVGAFAFGAHRRHDRTAQQFTEAFWVNLQPLGRRRQIPHVARQHQRNTNLQQLRREIQMALEVRAVQHVDHHIRRFVEQIVPRDNFLDAVGSERIGARQIDHLDGLVVVFALADGRLNRHAGVVANRDALASHRVKERALARVGVARNSNSDGGGWCGHGGSISY